MQRAAPRGRRERHAGKDQSGKARNQSQVAKALPHSEGITYKSPSDEVVMCLRVLCQEDAQGRHAVREMKEDPLVPSYRGRHQTAMSCFG